MSNSISLKFHPDLVEAILEEEKRTTWRVDHHGWVEPGDLISIQTSNGDLIGIAEVEWCKRTQIRYLDEDDMKWHKSYDSNEEIINDLKSYYPDYSITPRTDVVVIRFRLVNKIMSKEDRRSENNEISKSK